MRTKIDTLKYELGRYMKKVEDQGKEIAEWKAMCEGHYEINKILSAILSAVIMKNMKMKDDSFIIRIPVADVKKNLGQYKTETTKKEGNYIIQLTRLH